MKHLSFMKSVIAVLFVFSVVVVSAIDVHRPDLVPRYSGAQPNQWTMDYQAALDYAATNGLNTIVMFTGSWWCPYCQALEDKVISNPDWQSYLAANPAMLVMLDFNFRPVNNLPRDHEYNKCFLWDPEYLATNGLTEAQGDARLAYNYTLQDEFCMPSLLAAYGYSRVPYPTWVVLRADGSRCSRLTVSDFNDDSVTPAMAVAAIIRRYEQALLADPADEMDDEALLNPVPLIFPVDGSTSTPVIVTLSENDLSDNFSFEADPKSMLSFEINDLDGLPSTPLVVSVLKSDGSTVLNEEVINPAAGGVSSYRVPYTGQFFLKISLEAAQTNLVGYSLAVSQTPFNEEDNLTRIFKYRAYLKATKPGLATTSQSCEEDLELCYRETTRRSLQGYLYSCGGCTLQPNALVYFRDSDTAYHLLGGDGSAFLFLNIIGKRSNKTEGVLYFNELTTGLNLTHGGHGTFRKGLVSRMSGTAAGTINPPLCSNDLCQDLFSYAYDCEQVMVYETPDAVFGYWSMSYSSRDSKKADEQSALLYFKDVLPKQIEYIVENGVVIPRNEWLTPR